MPRQLGHALHAISPALDPTATATVFDIARRSTAWTAT
jgi:hypothetical protein